MENLKHVLVCGNGFDLAIGRKTSYWDFYQSEYCPKRYPAPLIAYLNQNLEGENVRWLDLETALQNYAIEANKKDFPDFFTQNEILIVKYILGESNEAFNSFGWRGLAEMQDEMYKKGKITYNRNNEPKVDFAYAELKKTAIERDRTKCLFANFVPKRSMNSFFNSFF